MKKRPNFAVLLLGGCFFATLFACFGSSATIGASTANTRVANLSSLTTFDSILKDVSGNPQRLSTALPAGDATCVNAYNVPNSGTTNLTVSASGSTVNLLSTAVSVETDQSVNTLLVFGPTTGLKVLGLNSNELPTTYGLYICDLSTLYPSNLQVFVKNITANTTTQTSPVAGVDGSREVAFPLTTAGTYEVDLRLSGSSTNFASGQVVVDATHPFNVVAFVDDPSGSGFVADVIHGVEGCMSPSKR